MNEKQKLDGTVPLSPPPPPSPCQPGYMGYDLQSTNRVHTNRYRAKVGYSLLNKEMFYLTTHSTHFIYGYMASDIW